MFQNVDGELHAYEQLRICTHSSSEASHFTVILASIHLIDTLMGSLEDATKDLTKRRIGKAFHAVTKTLDNHLDPVQLPTPSPPPAVAKEVSSRLRSQPPETSMQRLRSPSVSAQPSVEPHTHTCFLIIVAHLQQDNVPIASDRYEKYKSTWEDVKGASRSERGQYFVNRSVSQGNVGL